MRWRSALLTITTACALTGLANMGLSDPGSQDLIEDPVVEHHEWNGFLSCSVQTPELGFNACSALGVDPNDDFLHAWTVDENLESVVGAMVWDQGTANVNGDLLLLMEAEGMHGLHPQYARVEGLSPLEWRVDAGDVGDEYDFENVSGSMGLQYRVFAGGELNVVYQQPFTVYWDLYYLLPAPDDASALPDE